jgi:hypothetical protein
MVKTTNGNYDMTNTSSRMVCMSCYQRPNMISRVTPIAFTRLTIPAYGILSQGNSGILSMTIGINEGAILEPSPNTFFWITYRDYDPSSPDYFTCIIEILQCGYYDAFIDLSNNNSNVYTIYSLNGRNYRSSLAYEVDINYGNVLFKNLKLNIGDQIRPGAQMTNSGPLGPTTSRFELFQYPIPVSITLIRVA